MGPEHLAHGGGEHHKSVCVRGDQGSNSENGYNLKCGAMTGWLVWYRVRYSDDGHADDQAPPVQEPGEACSGNATLIDSSRPDTRGFQHNSLQIILMEY